MLSLRGSHDVFNKDELWDYLDLSVPIFGETGVTEKLGEVWRIYREFQPGIAREAEEMALPGKIRKQTGVDAKAGLAWRDLGEFQTDIDIRTAGLVEAMEVKQVADSLVNDAALRPPADLFDDPDYIPHGSPMHLVMNLVRQYESFDQPAARISAALGLMAHWAGRHVATGPLWLNLNILCVGESSSGKDAATKVINHRDLPVRVIRLPHGGGGLFNSLSEQPALFCAEDEIGITLSQMTAANGSHKESLKDMLLQLATIGDGVLRQPRYVASKNNLPPIVAPSFTLLGTSTPSTLAQTLNRANLESGLLPRFLLLHLDPTTDKLANLDKTRYVSNISLDPELISIAKSWLMQHGQNINEEDWKKAPIVREIPTNDEAHYLLQKSQVAWAGAAKEDSFYKIVYSRAPQLARRVALALAANRLTLRDLKTFRVYEQNRLEISGRDMELACNLVDSSTRVLKYLVASAEDEGKHKAEMDRAEGVIQRLSSDLIAKGGPVRSIIEDRLRSMANPWFVVEKLIAAKRVIHIPPPRPNGGRGRSKAGTYIHVDFAEKALAIVARQGSE